MPKKQQDGRYRTKVTVGIGSDGNMIYKYASGHSKKELAANVEELKKRHIGGVEVQRDATVGAYLAEWYKAFVQPGVSPSTDQHYRSALNKHILPFIGDKQMRAVTSIDLQSIMNSMSNLRRSTIGYVKAILKGAFREATASGVLDRDPATTIKANPEDSELRRALTDKETKAALKVAESHPDGLMLSLIYYTGMRRGEMLGLMWSDIDLKKNVIHVRRDIDFVTNDVGSVKSPAAERDIPIPTPLKRILSPLTGIGYIIKGPHTGQHMPQPTYVRTWKALMAAIYQADKKVEHADLNKNVKDAMPLIGSILTAHYFRHNYATLLYDFGVDVLTAQKYLGHADPATTMRIYTHLAARKEQRDKKKVIELFGK